jgi:four helix bundle protein
MYLNLNHQKLGIYSVSREFVIECYKLTRSLPTDEKFGMVNQIRRAALSVHLNIAEGASRRSNAERRRYFEIARGSVIEIDAALDIAGDLGYLKNIDLTKLSISLINCFKLLSGLIKSNLAN